MKIYFISNYKWKYELYIKKIINKKKNDGEKVTNRLIKINFILINNNIITFEFLFFK